MIFVKKIYKRALKNCYSLSDYTDTPFHSLPLGEGEGEGGGVIAFLTAHGDEICVPGELPTLHHEDPRFHTGAMIF